MSSHRRTLSKQGSISGRRKPSRAAMHSFRMASTEDSIFVDSTDAQASDTATLSSDMSSHRRTLSKQGSISGRRKPSRAAMRSFRMTSSEDSIFVDSTGKYDRVAYLIIHDYRLNCSNKGFLSCSHNSRFKVTSRCGWITL